MTNCTKSFMEFPAVKRRGLEVSFQGGDISSHGGLPLLREIDRRLGLMREVSKCVPDPRHPAFIRHSLESMLKQRVYGLALGYEDLNDHHQLRHDTLLQASVERDEVLASSPTLCRLDNWAHHRSSSWAIHQVILNQFIASFSKPPEELVLDFDATDDRIYGRQEGRFFHGYYDHYCFLPLYVFCGDQLLVAYLRPSKIDGAKHAWGILSLLVKRLRQAWPEVRLIFRGDSGFCRHRMLNWCENHNVGYCVGLSQNKRLNRQAAPLEEQMKLCYEQSLEPQREFMEFSYAAQSWIRNRRVIARLEYGSRGNNPRYIVTNLRGPAKSLYEDLYCQRGDMENRIKEIQLDLFSDRTSCHYFMANQFRVLLSALGYILLERLRAVGLYETNLAESYCGTIRLKLLKIGAVVLKNTRRIRVLLSSACPDQDLFRLAFRRLISA